MNSSTRLFAFDFDGVIIDSAPECLITAHNALMRLQGNRDQRSSLLEFNPQEQKRFRHQRIFIRRGEDYVYLLQALRSGLQFKIQREFDTYQEQYADRLGLYRETFYAERSRLRDEQPSLWLKLNPMYPGMLKILRHIHKSGKFVILTTKDLDSVKFILGHNDPDLEAQQMFQASRDLSKQAILGKYISDNHLAMDNIHFIDDHPGTLLDMSAALNVHVHCATWGYNTEDDEIRLEKAGISLLNLDALELLSGTCPASQSAMDDGDTLSS